MSLLKRIEQGQGGNSSSGPSSSDNQGADTYSFPTTPCDFHFRNKKDLTTHFRIALDLLRRMGPGRLRPLVEVEHVAPQTHRDLRRQASDPLHPAHVEERGIVPRTCRRSGGVA